MSELLKVYYITSNTRTCFFYRNSFNRCDRFDNVQGIKIKFGNDFESTTFGTLSSQPLPEVPDNSIGISCLMASRLGLRENAKVLVTNITPPAIESLQIIPRREEDYVVLLSCRSFIETNLLNQARVVAEGQILPIYVFTNILIDVEIGELKPCTSCGQLERFTEVTIIHPSEKTSQLSEGITSISTDDMRQQGNLTTFIADFNALLQNSGCSFSGQHNKSSTTELKCPQETCQRFVVWPTALLLQDEHLVKLLDTCIILTNNTQYTCTDGVCNEKFLCKVYKKTVANKPISTDSSSHEIESDDGTTGEGERSLTDGESNYTFSYVVSLNLDNNCKKTIGFCPPHIFKKLNVFVGSELTMEYVNSNTENVENIEKSHYNTSFHCEQILWKDLDNIKQSIIQNILNNIRFNHRINTLVSGGRGTGKTSLLNALIETLRNQFIYYKLINCKSLQGMKMEALGKIWMETLTACCCHEPAVLLVDDMYALTRVDEEDNQFSKLHSNRIVEMVTGHVRDFQQRYNLTVVATTIGLNELSNMISVHGPRLFPSVEKIGEMTVDDRNFVLKNMMEKKNADSSLVNLKKVAECTNGYTIQDLNDLVDKTIFKCLLRTGSNGAALNQMDMDLGLSESIPQSLRGSNRDRDRPEVRWEDVGGMEGTKKLLEEVFSWPSKYPNILQSCPLRLQRGALLYGAPGTGKTFLGSALASKCGLNFISVKGPEVLSKYVGASEEGVRNLFVQAQSRQPCLLFFDEFDSLAPRRGHDSTGVTDRVVNQLLTQLDGVESLTGVWVLAATSRPDLLDPALLRPGRLDKMIFCDVPNKVDRASILNILSRNLPKGEDVDLDEVSERSEGHTGADLQALLYNAQMLAIKEHGADVMAVHGATDVKVRQKHLMSALATTKPSLTPSEKCRYDEIYRNFLNSRMKTTTPKRQYADMKQKLTLA